MLGFIAALNLTFYCVHKYSVGSWWFFVCINMMMHTNIQHTYVLIFSYESMASLILFNVKLKFNPILRIDQMSNSTQDNRRHLLSLLLRLQFLTRCIHCVLPFQWLYFCRHEISVWPQNNQITPETINFSATRNPGACSHHRDSAVTDRAVNKHSTCAACLQYLKCPPAKIDVPKNWNCMQKILLPRS